MPAPRRYDAGRRSQRGEVLVVALPKEGGAEGVRKGSETPAFARRESTRLDSPDRSRGRKRFDFHPKNFRNYRLIWEMYKSERE